MQAFVVLAELWLASEIILLAGPLRGDALMYACVGASLVFCCALTRFLTSPVHQEPDTPIARRLLPVQLALLLLLIGIGLWFTRVAPANLGVALREFVEYALLPFAFLALLRVPLPKMGLGAFSRGSLGAAAVWFILPLFAIAYLVLYADVSAAVLGRRLIYSFFARGFSEEFLFRGALFGRLRSCMPAQWAAFAQALLFGLWYFGNNVAQAHNVVAALALIVPAQAAFGYAMAILVRRTGNLAIPALLHTTVDAVQALL